MWKVQWEPDSESQVDTVEQLDRLLDQLADRYQNDDAILVVVESRLKGDTLAIGIGRDVSVLSYVGESGEPPYYSSVGDKRGEDAVTFRYMGELTEFPSRKAVPYQLAREALRHFATTGERTARVSWEED